MSINERGTIIENVENQSLNSFYLIIGCTGLSLTFIFGPNIFFFNGFTNSFYLHFLLLGSQLP